LELEIVLIAWFSVSVNWDYDRFSQSETKQSDKYFAKVEMGKITSPTTVVDVHGKILMWYLPDLLLSHRVVRSTDCVQNLLFLLTFWIGRLE
jgi:hypothetical protein